jgi:hypothetical protein
MKLFFFGHIFRGPLLKIFSEIVRFTCLSDYFCIIRVPWDFFNMLDPCLHSKIDFKQQKIIISCRFISLNSNQNNHYVEQLDNVLKKTDNVKTDRFVVKKKLPMLKLANSSLAQNRRLKSCSLHSIGS